MPRYAPTFSHGGSSAPNFPAVSGSVTGPGRPISVFPAIEECAFYITISGAGTAVVTIEASGGALDATGNPPSNSWVDQSNGGYTLDAADPDTRQYLSIPATKAPWWRTNIISIDADTTIESGVSQIKVQTATGQIMAVKASYPGVENVQDVTFGLP